MKMTNEPRALPRPTDNKLKTVVWPIMKRTPTYLRLSWDLAREPAIPHRHKLFLYGLIAYQVSPIHWAVTVVPVLGQIDFPVLLFLAIRQMLVNCPPEVAKRCFARLNLSPTQLDEDYKALKKLTGDAASDACWRVGAEFRVAGKVAGKVGMKTLARMVVAAEKPKNRPRRQS
jgi:uncharacterized membrane protein YkvA (DUF1232 family)